MRTIKLKTTDASDGILTLQHPAQVAGMSGDGRVATYEITDVPDGVSDADVMRLANATTFFGCYSAAYDELGAGKILR